MNNGAATLVEPTNLGLSPMQAGMLYESLLHSDSAESRGGGYNLEQLHVRLAETIDSERLAQAFTQVTERHAILACGFDWEGHDRPRLRVFSDVKIPVTTHVSSLPTFLSADRALGFDLRQAPLMRVSLLATNNGHTDLVWTFHHILLDGRSFAHVLLEVFEIYRALGAGELPQLAPIPRPYTEFLGWLATLNHDDSARYFRELLAAKVTPTPLPAAEPGVRPLPQTGYSEHIERLPRSLLDRVKQLAEITGTTVGTVIHAAWALVLARFTHDEDVVFGSTRACRRSALDGNTDAMVGLFINTLPLRVQVGADLSVTDVLHNVRTQSLALRAHEHIPLSSVQAASEMPRGMPLFETLVMFENQELNETLQKQGGAAWLNRHCTLHEQPSLPLNVTVFETTELEFRLLFDRRRFTNAAVARLGACLARAVTQLSQDASRPMRELDILPPETREQILRGWNNTERAFANNVCIQQLFEDQVRRQPDALAVQCGTRWLSYADLDSWANRIARHLIANGAEPGRFVGVCLSRGLSLVAALLAVAKTGAAYVPLDPEYPTDRLKFMLEDTAAPLVVTEQQYAELFSCPIVELDGKDTDEIAARPSTTPPLTAAATDVCYAIFTSGSTGKPKGVTLTHRAVVNTLDWVNRSFKVGPGDRLLFVTSPCFDLSVYDTFGALGAGATVVVATAKELKDPQLLVNTVVSERITIWDSAPAALQRLATFFPTASPGSALRLVMLSGDWIPLSLPDAVRASFPDCQVRSLGGATEAAIWSNWYPIDTIDPRWTSVPYGVPIQNSRYHVLDSQLRPVPIGVPGDLYIGGTCLAQGYLNREELTAERFIRDPFDQTGRERLYKTGDLARYFDDGNLEFLGRADFQVKIRGFRVEIGEVEVALGEIEGVRENICSTFVDASGQKALVAYVVSAAGKSVDGAQLKRELARKVPDFMVPSYVVVLPALPLSANGKVDRKALPSPTETGATSTTLAPRTDMERTLHTIWLKVLKRNNVSVRDNFFELGGHSLLAVVLMSELKRETGIEVPLSRIVNYPTIEQLAQSLDPNVGVKTSPTALPENLVLLHAGGPKALFLVHDGDGEVLLYLTLARLVPRSFTVYGVQPKTLSGVPLAAVSIHDMAAFYVEHIKKVQPAGEYHLGGLCAGGVIAFEMARQMSALGDTVGSVTLLDAVQPTAPMKQFRNAKRRFSRFNRLWKRALHTDGVPPSSRAVDPRSYPTFANTARSLARKAANVVGYEVTSRAVELSVQARLRFLEQALERGWSWPAQLPTLSVRQIYAAARDRYRPGIARIHEVLLLKATQGHGGDEPATELTDDPLLGWEAYVDGKLEATEVRGGHSSMLQEPFVYEVALVMQRCLDPEFVTQPKPAPLSTRPDVDRDAAPQTLRIPSNPPVL